MASLLGVISQPANASACMSCAPTAETRSESEPNWGGLDPSCTALCTGK